MTGMTTFPVGVAFFPPTVQQVIERIKQAERIGVPMAWVPSLPLGPDALSVLTAAATQTSQIGLGTGIVISAPCHPLTRANEALVMAELAPQRFRLGVGASHQPVIEGNYGLSFARPLLQMREYLTVLRGLLWEGRIAFDGTYYHVYADYPAAMPLARFPIVLAAVRKQMIRLAGELCDGAFLTWTPLSYVRSVALPALEDGARRAHRPRPPLLVSAPIVLTTDFAVVREVARMAFAFYSSFPTYSKMFEEAGYPLTPEGGLMDALIQEIFVYGDVDAIRQRLIAIHEAGVDELVALIHPLKDPAREERIILEVLASL